MPLTLVSDPDPEYPEDAVVIPLDLSSAPPLDRLRAFVHGPLTDAERAGAQHRADRMTGRGGWR